MSPADCHPDKPNQGRGLCNSCYTRAKRAGTLDQYPSRGWAGQRRPRRTLQLAEDAAWVMTCTCRCHATDSRTVHGNGQQCPCGGLKPVADRLGVTLAALRKALYRARQYQQVAS